MSEQVWDLSLTANSVKYPNSSYQVTIPAPIARSLVAQGLNRAKLRVTKEGLLFTPYHSDGIRNPRHIEVVTLPEWK